MTTEQPWTIKRLLEWTTSYLQGKGVESARLEAQLLLAHALGCSRTSLYVRYEEVIGDGERAKFRELVQARVKGTPAAHLLGRKEFFSLEFEVGPDVLVPRQDTEWLVTECLTLAKPMDAPRVLDVGTGSGCVAVAVAARHKTASVIAIDVSPQALAVARRNAEKHKVSERVRFLQGDLFAPLAEEDRFDFILSNPPYVPAGDLAGLAPEVRDHDPRLALDGGPDGFTVIDRLIAGAAERLSENGWLLFEIGVGQEAEARRRLEQAGWDVGKAITDAGGVPRVMKARRRTASSAVAPEQPPDA
jgi:release factor glutamine methyltransferase